MKFLKGTGKILGGVGNVITAYQVIDEASNERYVAAGARLTVATIQTAALAFGPAGWAVSLGIGVIDAIWGDDFYNYLERELGN